MIHRNGTDFSQAIEFSTGLPDGDIAWAVYDESSVLLDSGTITPVADSVSSVITVPSAANTLGAGIISGYRDLVWSYMVAGEIVNDDVRYSVEARPPYGVTSEGVRRKLGVADHELPDEDISLIRAYYDFQTLVGAANLAAYTPDAPGRLRIADAIEALAALAVLPTMQVRVASKESSGTDTYQRQKVEWEQVALGLQTMVSGAIQVIIPTFDPLTGFGAVFILAPPSSDPITGA